MEDAADIELVAKYAGSIDDKLDELRAVFPSMSSSSIKKMLDAAGGDVQQAIILGQSKGFVD